MDLELISKKKKKYGNNFPEIAEKWNIYLEGIGFNVKLDPQDVSYMMALMKYCRIEYQTKHDIDVTDSKVDFSNYFFSWLRLSL